MFAMHKQMTIPSLITYKSLSKSKTQSMTYHVYVYQLSRDLNNSLKFRKMLYLKK